MGGAALVVVAAIVAAVILLAGRGGAKSPDLVHIPVPSGAMAPTFKTGEVAAVNPDAYETSEPQAGEIVVFHPPEGAESASECGVLVNKMQPLETGEACPKPTPGKSSQTFIKRIVAVGGDTLSIKEGHPVVNGVEKTDEPYIRPCGGGYECNLPKTIKIPPGYFFTLGDNRGESDDSRYWGPVPESWILGRVEN
jgi:signal peptidase I